MKKIGGVTIGTIQKKTTSKNSIGEDIEEWSDYLNLTGYLDYMSGDAMYDNYYAKVQESTHVFVTDYQPIEAEESECRMAVNGKIYEITLIDDPMELHKHIEIFLKYTGE